MNPRQLLAVGGFFFRLLWVYRILFSIVSILVSARFFDTDWSAKKPRHRYYRDSIQRLHYAFPSALGTVFASNVESTPTRTNKRLAQNHLASGLLQL